MQQSRSTLALTLFGSFQALRDGTAVTQFRGDKVRALLVYLAVESDRPHSRAHLASLLWPDQGDAAALANLSVSLARLRTALNDATDALLSTRQTVQWDAHSGAEVDVTAFMRLARSTDPELLEQAIALYRGPLLPGFSISGCPEFDEWLLLTREHCERLALTVLEGLAEAYIAAGRYQEAESAARRQLAIDAWHETAHRQVMQALAGSGQRAAALKHYENSCELLEAELGIELGAELRALYNAIRSATYSGTPEPQPAQRVTAAAPPALAPFPPQSGGTAPPFVARTQELARLHGSLEAALGGNGQVVFIAGEAGSGKTALAHAFAQQAQAANADLIVAAGGCSAHTGVDDPYLPFREILGLLTGAMEPRRREGMLTPENAGRRRDLMAVCIPILVGFGADLVDSLVSGAALLEQAAAFTDPQVPWLRRLAAQVDRAQQRSSGVVVAQGQLVAQVTEVLHRLAATRPLLLVLEDLHWADPSSMSLLAHLGRSIDHSRILILATYRPEDLADDGEAKPHPLRSALSEFKRYYGDIWVDLDRTTAVDGRQFIDALLDAEPNQLSEEFRQALLRQTEGHALFTAELLRDLQEREAVWRDPQRGWVERGPMNWESLPTRVEGVIEQRIDRLPPPLRHALSVASVEGEVFTAEVVARVQALDEHELVRWLGGDADRRHRLVNVQRVAWAGTQRLSRYRFRHHLFQTFVYQSLDLAERAYLHTAVATALETMYGANAEQVAVQLAHHFQVAGLVDQAVEYLRRAGEQARRVSANAEAIKHFGQALTLLSTVPASSDRAQRELALRIPYGNALIAVKGFAVPEVGRTFGRALELGQQLGATAQLFAVLHGLHHFRYMRGEWQAARELGEQLVALAEAEQAPALRTEAQRALGVVLWHLGEFVAAHEHTEHGIASYDRQYHHTYLEQYGQDPGVVCYGYSACTLWLLGHGEQALDRIDQTLDLAGELAHPFSLARALNFATMLHTFRRDAQRTLEYAEAGITLAKQHGFAYYLGWATILRGWALAELGHGASAIEQMLQGEAIWRATGVELSRHFYLALLAEAHGKAGNSALGIQVLAQAVEAVPSSGLFWEAELYRVQGELLQAQPTAAGDAEAEACFRKALAIARRQGARSLEAQAAASLDRLGRRQGTVRA